MHRSKMIQVLLLTRFMATVNLLTVLRCRIRIQHLSCNNDILQPLNVFDYKSARIGGAEAFFGTHDPEASAIGY